MGRSRVQATWSGGMKSGALGPNAKPWNATQLMATGCLLWLAACGSTQVSTPDVTPGDVKTDGSQDVVADTRTDTGRDLADLMPEVGCTGKTWEGEPHLALEGAGPECTNEEGVVSPCDLEIDALAAQTGETFEIHITLRNDGASPLQVLGLELQNPESILDLEPPPYAASTQNLADSYTLAHGGVVTLVPASAPECGPSELTIIITYFHRDLLQPAGKLTIVTDAPNLPNGLLIVNLVAGGNGPRISVEPQKVSFYNVELNDSTKQTLAISNVGNQPLELTGFELVGDAGFEWVIPYHTTHPNPDGSGGMIISPFVTLLPGDSLKTKVYFNSLEGEHWATLLRIHCNDPYAPDGFDVPLLASVASACAAVQPTHLDFATQAIGTTAPRTITLSACENATEDLTIKEIRLAPGTEYSNYFSLDLSTLPNVPSPSSPLVLSAGQQAEFKVRYKPQSASLPGPDGNPTPHMGLLQVVTGDSPVPTEVPLQAICGVAPCPKAVIQAVDGDLVYPGTTLQLVGSGSAPATGNLVNAKWGVSPPPGSLATFQPNDTAFDVTFLASLVGVYEFTLDVWDGAQTKSCQPATYKVTAFPDNAVYVELTWQTPGDSNESDTGPDAGSDLDLHFAHPWANQPDTDGDGMPDPWFDNTFDCFWFNAAPDWGSYAPGSNDNPAMIRDDPDGAGPEVVALDAPEDDLTYSIGVHYWDEHGYGDALARVRVYLYGALVYDSDKVKLHDQDMWFVARLHWPSGLVDPVVAEDGGAAITPQYANPYFYQ